MSDVKTIKQTSAVNDLIKRASNLHSCTSNDWISCTWTPNSRTLIADSPERKLAACLTFGFTVLLHLCWVYHVVWKSCWLFSSCWLLEIRKMRNTWVFESGGHRSFAAELLEMRIRFPFLDPQRWVSLTVTHPSRFYEPPGGAQERRKTPQDGRFWEGWANAMFWPFHTLWQGKHWEASDGALGIATSLGPWMSQGWSLECRASTKRERFNKQRELRGHRSATVGNAVDGFWFATILAPWFRRPFQSISFYPKDNSHTQLHQDCMTAWEWNESYGH